MDGFGLVAAFVLDVSEQRIPERRIRRAHEQGARLLLGLIERGPIRADPDADLPDLRPREQREQRRRLAFDAQGFADVRERPIDRIPAQFLPRLQEQLERPHVGDGPFRQPPLLVRGQRDIERFDDLARHPLLHVEHVVHRPAVFLGPELRVGRGVYQLRGDAQARCRLSARCR